MPTQPQPRTVGKYLLGERMAVGGMAELFHAEPIEGRLDAPIVLKQMLPALAARPDFVAMFVEEARISTRLDHPNIVKVHDFEASDHGLFLVMELIDGPDLLSVMTRSARLGRHLDPELAVYVACHALEALDYAHNAVSPRGERLDLVHRDVSPSNILLSQRGHVKLADFGIARAATLGRTQELATGTLKGKFGYMSPEQVKGGTLDARSDVFSMGVVLAEMLMLRRLFRAPDELELLLMVRRAELARLDRYGAHIPRELDAIVRTALAVDRDDRFASAGGFRDALVDWLDARPRRTGAARLAELLRELEQQGGPLCAWTPREHGHRSALTMSGTATRIADRAASAAAAIGRVAYAATPAPAVRGPAPVTVPPLDAPRASTSRPLSLEAGELDAGMVVELLCEIARARRTGALLLRSGEQYKEAYFRAGDPVFVRCNVREDRFGEFLVRRGLISRDQLDRAIAVLPHFDGKLGQALVSLGLIRPVDAVRLLEAQVGGKLVGACGWTRGSFEFRADEHNPWPALTLQLETAAIVTQAWAAVPTSRVSAWVERHRACTATLRADRTATLALPPAVDEPLRILTRDAVAIGDMVGALAREARAPFAATGYVLWRCGLLRVTEPAPRP